MQSPISESKLALRAQYVHFFFKKPPYTHEGIAWKCPISVSGILCIVVRIMSRDTFASVIAKLHQLITVLKRVQCLNTGTIFPRISESTWSGNRSTNGSLDLWEYWCSLLWNRAAPQMNDLKGSLMLTAFRGQLWRVFLWSVSVVYLRLSLGTASSFQAWLSWKRDGFQHPSNQKMSFLSFENPAKEDPGQCIAILLETMQTPAFCF